MKRFITPLIVLISSALLALTACSNLIPEREYPNPGYVQSDEILVNTNNPIVSIVITPSANTVVTHVPFRVDTYAVHQDGCQEKINYVAEYTVGGNLTQTNINEFVAFAAGDGTITATYNGATGSATIHSEQ